MRYKPKSTAALHIALGGLPDKMRVEADKNLGVSAHTVGELRKVTAWPEMPTRQRKAPPKGHRRQAHLLGSHARPAHQEAQPDLVVPE
jgi:hypothetical protein